MKYCNNYFFNFMFDILQNLSCFIQSAFTDQPTWRFRKDLPAKENEDHWQYANDTKNFPPEISINLVSGYDYAEY